MCNRENRASESNNKCIFKSGKDSMISLKSSRIPSNHAQLVSTSNYAQETCLLKASMLKLSGIKIMNTHSTYLFYTYKAK